MADRAGFSREILLQAFDRLGTAAIAEGKRLELAVYGGSALMLASNFRYASEDADVSVLEGEWPVWLTGVVERVARELGLSQDWLNDAVSVHLSTAASLVGDHTLFGSFPREGDAVGLTVYVPTAKYLLAMKLKAFRINDPVKGPQEAADIVNLMKVAGIESADGALALLARYYPRSAAHGDRLRFLLKHLLASESGDHAPRYPR